MEKRYIAYYRVSTQAQGSSGLGLDAQRASVLNFIHHNGNTLVDEYTEIESGSHDQRPMLLKAIEAAKSNDACLCIAKLDRLSRNVSFIANLMESNVPFVACDIPEATPLTLHIFAAMAEFERKRISERTKEAFAAKKRREPNFKWSTKNLTNDGRVKGQATISKNARTDQNNRHAYWRIKPLRESGMSFQRIAERLNDENYRTRLGCAFHAAQVRNVWKRMEPKNGAGEMALRKE